MRRRRFGSKGEADAKRKRERKEEELGAGETPETSAGSLTPGFVLPALTPTALSLAGAHELVRMER